MFNFIWTNGRITDLSATPLPVLFDILNSHQRTAATLADMDTVGDIKEEIRIRVSR